jgi:branched-chain amino acid transport system ATP-binding protein
MEIILKGEKVSKNFGGLFALKDVDFYVKEGEIVALIGPNGAGKTTLFNCLCGLYPFSGDITFRNRSIKGLKPYEICKLEIGRTFQIVKPFLEMTVIENVMVAALYGARANYDHINLEAARDIAMDCLEQVNLKDKRDWLAKNLTLQEKKLLELARALGTKPRLLLLDEPISGLSPTEVIDVLRLIRKLRDEIKLTIFWIEHVMNAVMKVADRIIVLHQGQKIAEGTANEIANNEKVIEAYLGKKAEI